MGLRGGRGVGSKRLVARVVTTGALSGFEHDLQVAMKLVAGEAPIVVGVQRVLHPGPDGGILKIVSLAAEVLNNILRDSVDQHLRLLPLQHPGSVPVVGVEQPVDVAIDAALLVVDLLEGPLSKFLLVSVS